jgi:hypothetical protein
VWTRGAIVAKRCGSRLSFSEAEKMGESEKLEYGVLWRVLEVWGDPTIARKAVALYI